MTETINHPRHYQHASGIECWQLSAYMPHPLASALEYVWRYEAKNGVEDLKKARWWLQCWLDNPDIPRVSQKGKFLAAVSQVEQVETDEARGALIYDICAAADTTMARKSKAISTVKSAVRLLDILIERLSND